MRIGVKSLYYALLTQDTSAGVVYGTPAAIAGVNAIKISLKSDKQDFYADDALLETYNQTGVIDVEITLGTLDVATQAALLGHTISGGVMEIATGDQAPYVGLAFKALKTNGGYVYYRLLKGKFMPVDADFATKEDKAKLQPVTVKGTFIARVYDDKLFQKTDDAQTDYVPATGAAWFTSFGPADSTPPTLSSTTPANSATGVATSSTFVWTFSEALQPACVTGANFAIVKDSDGSAVSGTLALSGGGTIVTFTPGSALSASTAYRAIAGTGVKDLAGNAFAGISVRKFTTA